MKIDINKFAIVTVLVSMCMFTFVEQTFAEDIDIVTSSGVEVSVPKECSRLSGLIHASCARGALDEECTYAEVVCNLNNTENNSNEEGDAVEYGYQEKSDYCLLPSKYCYNEKIWGEGGLKAYQDERQNDINTAIEAGDLGSMICNQMARDTEGFIGCEDELDSKTVSYDLPLEETTFTQFDAEFEPPSPDGYSQGLTESTGIREYILKVADFVLGFLGLIAVLVIIYGGFTYVTAAGDEGKTETGKNCIKFSIIGIVIIFGAFALVRTVICYLPVGGDDRASFCRSGGSFASVAAPNSSSGDLIDSKATTLENAKARLTDIAHRSVELSDVYKKINTAANYFPTVEIGLSGGLNEVSSLVARLSSIANDMPRVMQTLDIMSQYLKRQSPVAKADISFAKYLITALPGFGNAISLHPSNSTTSQSSSYSDITSGEFIDAYDFVEKYSQILQTDLEDDYQDKLDQLIQYSKSLEVLFEFVEKPKKAFEEITLSLQDLKTSPADVLKLQSLYEKINAAYKLIGDLDFVKVKLNASVKKCTAPCVVLFDSIGSIDPSNQTIVDTAHSWDLDGDGVYDESSSTCAETKTTTVSCVYDVPGTYIASLGLSSSSPDMYPSGLGFTRVEVLRPLSKIKINLTTPGGVNVLALDNTTSPVVKNSPIKYTVEEARSGITFDASGSLNSSGVPITDFIWSIGAESYEGNTPTKTFTFTTKGSYKVVLEVKDVSVTEKAVIVLDIGSPAAHFEILNAEDGVFTTGQTIKFDGTYSKSDNGSISTYQWSIYKGEELIKEASLIGSDFSFTPTSPGSYRAILSIMDSVGEADAIEKTFIVESQKPTACFTYDIPDVLSPGTVHFHSCSTDPDPSDDLGYNWNIEGAEYIEGTSATSENPVAVFTATGSHSVTLNVNDQYIEDSLRKEDSVTQDIILDSVLDVSLEIPNGFAYQLSDTASGVDVSFIVESTTGTYYEIDYGDSSVKQGAEGSGQLNFAHTYTTAGVYNVTASVYNDDDERNFVTKRIFIGNSNSTLPVVMVLVGDNVLDSTGGSVTVSKNVPVQFDGGDSLNRDGSGRNLLYSINFGDGIVDSQKKSSHVYEEVGVYEVTFTVTDEGSGVNASINLSVNVIDKAPKVRSLTSLITSKDITTPVDISVSTDAQDEDGRIVQYTWYLYDSDNTSSPIDSQVSNSDRTMFSFHGIGTTGEEHRVYICVSVKDDGGNETNSCSAGPYTYITTFTGENEPPKAKFSVADSTVNVGDPVIFYDESTDDNEISSVIYDVDGNGFLDDTAQVTHSFSHEYTRVGTYDVRIKVTDSNGASSVSPKKTIVVESSVEEPVAKIQGEVQDLKLTLTDNSEVADGVNVASRIWDFNTSVDSDGDGKTDNDVDATSDSTSKIYDKDGHVTVQLTVIDSQGNVDSVTKEFTLTQPELEARLLTTPAADPSDNKVHLTGDQAAVNVDFSESLGDIKRYVIDGNTLYDSNGNGVNDDDEDQVFTSPRKALFVYKRAWAQPFVMKLTVYDRNNNASSVTKMLLFDPLPKNNN